MQSITKIRPDPNADFFQCSKKLGVAYLVEREEKEELYLLQHMESGYVGNCPCFWSVKGNYTIWINEAKKFTKKEAENIIRGSKGTHSWQIWPVNTIIQAAKTVVDIQDLRKSDERR